ncbi:2-hydroxyacid dehydrogenase [Acinetobacter qingfengensis]|uniref:Glycerate dehydrogenase n=1 Tax=Acinetobacter qingfengensis TaxID=1262585 RepID=A0A1E7RA26_9GAMM|nr:2-hydroxyacid dehydrogenase [Acinetobacter qingfengensis]KAA8733929.1 2-hydroxyacid dehydrogenase [Acinetobacter qingfengensis]OEY96152.1 glycerate dehydrogenase [Acinetobacter qingfengensis]
MSLKAVFLDYASLDQSDLNFNQLKQQFDELYLYPSTQSEEIIERLKNADVVITNKSSLSEHTIRQLPNLKLILISATGTNNVDLVAAKQRNIPVCNCQGYGTHAVAQHTMSLILALATQVIKYNQAVKQGRWQQSEQFCFLDYPIMELAGKKIGILGYGELGQAVARLAQAFGMQILIGQLPHRPKKDGYLQLDELLAQVDILTLHCPLTPETENLIDEKELSKMKNTAFVINVARGGIINEQALATALINRTIAGAAIDVLTVEPPSTGNPLLDPNLTNLIITPHSAWGSVEARQKIVDQLTENVKAYKEKQLIRCVN